MSEAETRTGLLGERFTLVVLVAMVLTLGYVRFVLLPQQDRAEPVPFHFQNPMLDAVAGERVLFSSLEDPTNVSCSIVRENGLVLRPDKGPEGIGRFRSLRAALPYLACDVHDARRGREGCSGGRSESILYALNYFGMPHDTQVRVDSIRPRWMRWGERELVVYEVVLQRYGALGGTWTTYISRDAPVTGLVKWTSLLPNRTVVVYREVPEGG